MRVIEHVNVRASRLLLEANCPKSCLRVAAASCGGLRAAQTYTARKALPHTHKMLSTAR